MMKAATIDAPSMHRRRRTSQEPHSPAPHLVVEEPVDTPKNIDAAAADTIRTEVRGYRGALTAVIEEQTTSWGEAWKRTTRFRPDGTVGSIREEWSKDGHTRYSEEAPDDIANEIDGEIVTTERGTTETRRTRYGKTYDPHVGSLHEKFVDGRLVESRGRVGEESLRETSERAIIEMLKQRWLATQDMLRTRQ